MIFNILKEKYKYASTTGLMLLLKMNNGFIIAVLMIISRNRSGLAC